MISKTKPRSKRLLVSNSATNGRCPDFSQIGQHTYSSSNSKYMFSVYVLTQSSSANDHHPLYQRRRSNERNFVHHMNKETTKKAVTYALPANGSSAVSTLKLTIKPITSRTIASVRILLRSIKLMNAVFLTRTPLYQRGSMRVSSCTSYMNKETTKKAKYESYLLIKVHTTEINRSSFMYEICYLKHDD